MPMCDLPSRQIVKEHEFEEQLSRLIIDPELAQSFIDGAEEILAKEPTLGMPVSPNGKVWYLPMAPVEGRRVSLFYAFDEQEVILLWIVAED
jgi:hypothetical protein